MRSRGCVDCSTAGVEERVQVEEGYGVGRDVEGCGVWLGEGVVCLGEDGEEGVFVGFVGGLGHVLSGDVACTAVYDDAGFDSGGLARVVHVCDEQRMR